MTELTLRQIAAILVGEPQPCPKCGEAEVYHDYWRDGKLASDKRQKSGLFVGGYWIECHTCGHERPVSVATDKEFSRDATIARWNNQR